MNKVNKHKSQRAPSSSDKGKEKDKTKVKHTSGGSPKAKATEHKTIVPEEAQHDVFGVVAENLDLKSKKNLRAVSKTSKTLITPHLSTRVELNATDLSFKTFWQKMEEFFSSMAPYSPVTHADPGLQSLGKLDERMKFAEENNIKFLIAIDFKNDADDNEIQNVIDFINDPRSAPYLKYIESINLGDITSDNQAKVEELLQLIAKNSNKFSQLTHLTVRDISQNVTLTIPQLDNLTHLTVRDIFQNATLIIPQLDNLTHLTVRDIWNNATLTIPQLDNLTHLIVGDIWNNATLTIPQLDNLTHLTVRHIWNNATLTIPQLDNLTHLTVKLIWDNATLAIPQLDNLTHLTVGDIEGNATLNMKALPRSITQLSLGRADNNPAMQQLFDDLQKQFQKLIDNR